MRKGQFVTHQIYGKGTVVKVLAPMVKVKFVTSLDGRLPRPPMNNCLTVGLSAISTH